MMSRCVTRATIEAFNKIVVGFRGERRREGAKFEISLSFVRRTLLRISEDSLDFHSRRRGRREEFSKILDNIFEVGIFTGRVKGSEISLRCS